MNPDPSPSSAAKPPSADLAGAVATLRASFHVVLVVLTLLACALSIFLFRQVAMARRQVAEASEYVLNYQKNTEPAIARFVAQLQSYARTNAEFAPVLSKYATLTPQGGAGGLPLPPKE
ncbi:MAG: hypothetical protein FJ404_13325 [Verrucomicrobia bacterium]|nr:hypothetical protein [Verrucomicrobiota bacterium]